jgi:LuxR family maltose regulon positive regulatory protein
MIARLPVECVQVATVRFTIPTTRRTTIPRRRLLEQLVDWRELHLITVVAPTGYGKSTFVAQWMRSIEDPDEICSWITLDETNTPPEMLIQTLAEALHRHFPTLADAVAEMRAGHLSTDQLVTQLLKYIEQTEREIVVAFDDYHLVQDAASHAIIQRILDRGFPHLHLVLLSRTQPPLRISRAFVSGTAVAFEERQLRVDHDEFDAFVNASRLAALDAELQAEIERHAEGWFAALRLIEYSIADAAAGDARSLFGARTGALLIEHLEAEAFARLDADMQNFLVDVAALPFLSPELASAALELDAARCTALIQRAVDENSFITGYAVGGVLRHRLHPLFRDLLNRKAHDRGVQQNDAIRRRAAVWLAAHGEIDEALALLLPDQIDAAADILSAVLRPALLSFDLTTSRRRLKLLPESALVSRPQLAIDAAWLWFFAEENDDGRAVARAQAAATAHPNLCTPELRAELSVLESLALIVQCRTTDAVAAVEALHLMPCSDVGLAAGYRCVLPSVLPTRPPDHLVRLRHAEEIFQKLDFAHGALETALMQSVLQQRTGDASGATSMFERTEALLRYFHREHSFDAVEVHLYFGDHLYGLNRLADARTHFERAIAAGERLGVQWPNTYHARIGLHMCDISEGALHFHLDMQQDALDWIRIVKSAPPAVCMRIAWLRMLRDARLGFPERCRQTAAEFGVAPDQLTTTAHEMQWLVSLAGAVLGRSGDAATEPQLCHFIAHLESDGNLWLSARMQLLLALHRLDNGAPDEARELAAALAGRSDGARLICDFPSLHALLAPSIALVEPLSDRELHILSLLSTDLVNKEIAHSLSISIHTLYTHLRSIYRKLGVHTREDALEQARRLGLT